MKGLIFYLMILPIFLVVLSWSTVVTQFHLDKQITLCCMTGIKKIVAMQSNKISVEANGPAVTILNGANFQNIVSEIPADSSNSQIIVTSNAVFISDGSKVVQKTIQNRTNVTFVEAVGGDMLLTDKYALFVGVSELPTLNKINFPSMTVETYKYESAPPMLSYPGCLSDLKNGQIIFGERLSVYILNNETLEVEQALTQTESDTPTQIQSIVSLWNATSNQTVILIQGNSEGKYSTHRLNKITKKFEFFSRFNNPTSVMTLTSTATAVSIREGKLLYWQNFDEQVAADASNETEYYLSYAQKIILSHSEDFMVAWNNDSSRITFATMLEDYSLLTNFTVQLTSTGTVMDRQSTKDDSFVFYILSESLTGDLQFHITDIKAREQWILVDDNATKVNPQAFLLLEAYLIILTIRGSGNSSCFLELRNATDKSVPIISQLKVDLSITPFGAKLLGNEYWNSTFTLVTQAQLASQFLIQDGQITLLPIQSGNISFTNSFACQQYLISIPISNGDFYVYYASNMSLAKQMPNQFACDSYFAKEHIFIAEYEAPLFREAGSFIYDFSQNTYNWEAGLFYREYQRNSGASRVIYSKRKLYFIAYHSASAEIGKIIYDLGKIPIKKTSPLAAEGYSMPPDTFKIMTSNINSSCLWVFMIKDYGLLKHDECQPLSPTAVNISQIANQKLFLSSNKEYVIFSYTQQQFIGQAIIEVRQTNNITHLVKTTTIDRNYSVSSVDITSDQKMVVNMADTQILIFDMEIQESINSLDFTNIDLYDISANGIIAMIGYSSKNSTIPVLAVKQFGQSSFLLVGNLSKAPAMLKISPLGSTVVICKSNSAGYWFIARPDQSYGFEQADVILDLKFIQQCIILSQFAQGFSIVTVSPNQPLSNNQFVSSPFITAVNNDGTLVAMIVGPQTVKIYRNNMLKITTFSAPLQSIIVDISFSAANQLYAVTSDNTLYVVSPTPCPANFINVDSVCMCPQNLTNSTGACTCRQNFTPSNGVCLCENGFTYDGLNCSCNSNATIIGAACACKQNFVLSSEGCLCTNGFTLDSGDAGKCICQDGCYIEESRCKQCSLLCASCDGSVLFCTSFSVIFYVGVYVIGVLLLLSVVLIRYLIKKKKQKDSSLMDNEAQTKNAKSSSENDLQAKLRHENEDEKIPQ